MIQYFHYHPILGLQYFSDEITLEVNFGEIPPFDIGDMITLMEQQGVIIVDSFKNNNTILRKLGVIIHNLYVK